MGMARRSNYALTDPRVQQRVRGELFKWFTQTYPLGRRAPCSPRDLELCAKRCLDRLRLDPQQPITYDDVRDLGVPERDFKTAKEIVEWVVDEHVGKLTEALAAWEKRARSENSERDENAKALLGLLGVETAESS